MPLDQMAKIYYCKTKTLYPYEHSGLDFYQEVIGNLKIEEFKSSLSSKFTTQEEVNNFNEDSSHKTGKDLTIEYLQCDVEILDYCMNEYVKLNIIFKDFGLYPLHYVILPGYSFDCWLMSRGVILDTLQDEQLLDDFVEAKRVGISGIMGDIYINHSNRSIRKPASQIWYIDANNIYGYAMMQKLPYKGFEYYSTSPDEILKSPDDGDHGYYIVRDINFLIVVTIEQSK